MVESSNTRYHSSVTRAAKRAKPAASGAARTRRPGRPRQLERRKAARERIVEAAALLFGRQGFAATTTAEIARRARASEGTVFHHFPTKRALLAEVGRREGERVIALAAQGVDPTAPPPEPEEMLRPLFAYAREHPDAYRLFAMDGDLEDLDAGFAAKRERVTGGLAILLAGWSARGLLRRMNPDIVAELIFSVVDGAVRRLVLEAGFDDEEAWLQETCHAVRSLLAPLSPGPAGAGTTTPRS